jgi:hypothetical protein
VGLSKDTSFLGPSKDMRFQERKGPSKDMRFQLVSGGETKKGSIKRHEVFGSNKKHEVSGGEAKNGSNYTRLQDIELPSRCMVRSINAHQNLLMVITVQRAATGSAGAKPLLGSANTVWFG